MTTTALLSRPEQILRTISWFEDYGAFELKDPKGAYALYKKVGALNSDQLVPFMY